MNTQLTATFLRDLAGVLTKYADTLAQESTPVSIPTNEAAPPPAQAQPTPAPTVSAPVQPLPTVAPTYTIEQIAQAAAIFADVSEQNRAAVLGLMSQFGLQVLTGLAVEQYGAFAAQLRALGAAI